MFVRKKTQLKQTTISDIPQDILQIIFTNEIDSLPTIDNFKVSSHFFNNAIDRESIWKKRLELHFNDIYSVLSKKTAEINWKEEYRSAYSEYCVDIPANKLADYWTIRACDPVRVKALLDSPNGLKRLFMRDAQKRTIWYYLHNPLHDQNRQAIYDLIFAACQREFKQENGQYKSIFEISKIIKSIDEFTSEEEAPTTLLKLAVICNQTDTIDRCIRDIIETRAYFRGPFITDLTKCVIAHNNLSAFNLMMKHQAVYRDIDWPEIASWLVNIKKRIFNNPGMPRLSQAFADRLFSIFGTFPYPFSTLKNLQLAASLNQIQFIEQASDQDVHNANRTLTLLATATHANIDLFKATVNKLGHDTHDDFIPYFVRANNYPLLKFHIDKYINEKYYLNRLLQECARWGYLAGFKLLCSQGVTIDVAVLQSALNEEQRSNAHILRQIANELGETTMLAMLKSITDITVTSPTTIHSLQKKFKINFSKIKTIAHKATSLHAYVTDIIDCGAPTLKALLDSGMNIHLPDARDGDTPLHAAIKSLRISELYINDESGYKRFKSRHNSLKKIGLLLEYGADVYTTTNKKEQTVWDLIQQLPDNLSVKFDLLKLIKEKHSWANSFKCAIS